MAPEALVCKECDSSYPLDARYVCERCFGPLEVAYDFGDLDPAEARRKIQAGSRGIWRYADFLPFDERPRDPLEPGLTPLIRAGRLADALGLREVSVKNDAANPTHSFKDRVVAVGLARRASSASKRSPARRPEIWRTPLPPTPRRRESARTSSFRPISRSRSCSPPAFTAPSW